MFSAAILHIVYSLEQFYIIYICIYVCMYVCAYVYVCTLQRNERAKRQRRQQNDSGPGEWKALQKLNA